MNNAHVFLTKAIFNFGNIAYIFVHIVVIPLMVNSCLPFPIVSIESLKRFVFTGMIQDKEI